MAQARHDLGPAISVKAEARGQPGQRSFRILVEAQGGSAVIWLEKEQLVGLALAIERVIALAESSKTAKASSRLHSTSTFHAEFKARSLTLTYDERAYRFGILAQDVEDAESGPPAISMTVSREQAGAFAEAALAVCAAGRPRCPLCSQPMNPGEAHACARSNGHGLGKLSGNAPS